MDEIQYSQDDSLFSGCQWVFGEPRSGKTTMLVTRASQEIRKGNNVIIINPFWDADLTPALIKNVYSCGRHNDFLYFMSGHAKFMSKMAGDGPFVTSRITSLLHEMITSRIEKDSGFVILFDLYAYGNLEDALNFGRSVLTAAQEVVLTSKDKGFWIDPPFCIYIDEASHILRPEHMSLLQYAHTTMTWVNLYCQSITQASWVFGNNCENVLDGAREVIFMKLRDHDSALYASNRLGLKMSEFSALRPGEYYSVRKNRNKTIKVSL